MRQFILTVRDIYREFKRLQDESNRKYGYRND